MSKVDFSESCKAKDVGLIKSVSKSLRSQQRYASRLAPKWPPHMDNDLWPVVRESARRVLRLENILFRTPKKFNEEILQSYVMKYREYIPSKHFPEIEYVESSSVEILHKNSSSTEYEKIIEIEILSPMPKFVGSNAIWTKDGNGLLNHAWNYLLLVIQVVLAVEVLILKNGGTKKNLEKIGSPPIGKK